MRLLEGCKRLMENTCNAWLEINQSVRQLQLSVRGFSACRISKFDSILREVSGMTASDRIASITLSSVLHVLSGRTLCSSWQLVFQILWTGRTKWREHLHCSAMWCNGSAVDASLRYLRFVWKRLALVVFLKRMSTLLMWVFCSPLLKNIVWDKLAVTTF